MRPRKHQQEVIKRAQLIKGSSMRSSKTVLDVVPGGGKSRCISTLYREAGMKGKVIWVAPRLSLQSQAVEAAAEGTDGKGSGGLRLAPDVHQYRPRQHDGFVTNYAMLARHVKKHRTYLWDGGPDSLLVLDEVHHCGVHVGADHQPGWTAGVMELMKLKRRHHLLLTGTPYRGDRRPVLGMSYDADGQLIRSEDVITYGRRDAVKDRAITPNRMYWLDGPTSFTIREKGEDVPYALDSFRDLYNNGPWNKKKERLARGALRAFLAWSSIDCVHKPAIRQAWRDLQVHRSRGFKKAQLIVTTQSQGQAAVLRHWMEKELSIRTALAVSDYGASLAEVQRFRLNQECDALVTVGMAYEGLDAPYVTHLVHLGRIRQPSWLMQYFARAWRWGPREWPQTKRRRTFIYAPIDPAMLNAVKTIDSDTLGLQLPALLDEEPEDGFGKLSDDAGWSGKLATVTPGLIF